MASHDELSRPLLPPPSPSLPPPPSLNPKPLPSAHSQTSAPEEDDFSFGDAPGRDVTDGFQDGFHYVDADMESDVHAGVHADVYADVDADMDIGVANYGNFFEWEEWAAGVDAWHAMMAASSSSNRRGGRSASLGKAEDAPPLTWPKLFRMPFTFAVERVAALADWLAQCHRDIQKDQKLLALSVKAGLAVLLTSTICVLPPPFDSLSTIGVWAVVTVDCVFESNVGLAFSKGVNRVVGTFTAGALAVGANHLGPLLGGFHPHFVVLCCTLSTVVLTFYKYKAPFKERWNYAVVMALVTFHILVVSGFHGPREDLVLVPLARLAMIVAAFLVVTLVNVTLRPAFAGDALHALMTNNFTTAASILERCIEEYEKGTILDHGPEVWNKSISGDDVTVESLPKLYGAVVQSDVEVDKLLGTVPFEPCHGRFFYGYPWHLYDDMNDNLRYAVYDIIGLDSCLRAEIQAPEYLRLLFKGEMDAIGKPCSKILRALGTSMERHAWVDVGPILRKAEEAALILQHRVCKQIPSVLGLTEQIQSPNPRGPHLSPSYEAMRGGGSSGHSRKTFLADSYEKRGGTGGQHRNFPRNPSSSSQGEASREGGEERRGEGRRSGSVTPVTGTSIQRMTSALKGPPGLPKAPSVGGERGGEGGGEGGGGGSMEGAATVMAAMEPRKAAHEEERLGFGGVVKKGEFYGRRLSIEEDTPSSDVMGLPMPFASSLSPDAAVKPGQLWRENSIEEQWAGTVERISALSLIKFVSILLEIVAKMKFVVETMDELAVAARFDGAAERRSQVEVEHAEPLTINVEALKEKIKRRRK